LEPVICEAMDCPVESRLRATAPVRAHSAGKLRS